ncbi:hypothetical protein E2542_SST10471 [Spatholobus suberectus]|nr:hypothetical protein E2542_SST10471 [Spatholobus suberectus]
MDSFSFNNLQAEKANTTLKHRKLRRVASLFRIIEVCAVFVLISRFSMQLPVAVRNSSEYFRDLSLFMNSPRFVFLIGNAIIITLFAQFSAQGSGRNVQEQELYQEFFQNSTKNQRHPEKQRIRTEDGIENGRVMNADVAKYPESVADCSKKKQRMKTGEANIGLVEKKGYRRCQTEIVREKRRLVLRRCETENGRKSIEAAPREEVAKISCPEDGMSNEEFRRTVEAFIARQQRIRREEDYYLM